MIKIIIECQDDMWTQILSPHDFYKFMNSDYVSIIKVILIVIKKNSYEQHKENISNGLIGNYCSKRDKILEFSY